MKKIILIGVVIINVCSMCFSQDKQSAETQDSIIKHNIAFQQNLDADKSYNMGIKLFEEKKYMEGTKQLAQAVASSECYSVIGGGDTIAALNSLGLIDKIDFVSTGGGAMLEFLAGKELPGLKALEESL